MEKYNLKSRIGISFFLVFFVLTPLFPKIRISEGIFIEPLLPFLILGIALVLWSCLEVRNLTGILKDIRGLIFSHRLSSLFYALIGFLLISFLYGFLLTGIFSIDDFLHLPKFALYFLPFPLALYAGRFLKIRGINVVLSAFVVVGVVTALISFLRVYNFIKLHGGVDFWVYSFDSRSTGFLGQFLNFVTWGIESTGKAAHATYGLYASVVLAVCLGFISKTRDFTWRWFGFVFSAIIIIFGAIVYALSRGALMTASLVTVAWFAYLIFTRKRLVLLLSTILLVGTSFVLISRNPAVVQKYSSTFQGSGGPSQGVDSEFDPSTVGRLERWNKIFSLFRERPEFAVLGVGYSSPNLQSFAGVNLTHSFFLDMWVRGGLVALLLAIAVWFLLFKTVLGLVFSKNAKIRIFGFPLLGFVLGWFIDNLISGEQFFSDAPMIAFWGVLGLVESLRQLDRERGSKKVLIALTSSGLGGAPKVVYDLLKQARVKGLGFRGQGDNKFEFVVAAPAGGEFNKKFRDLGYKVYGVPLDRIGVKGFTKLLRIARKEQIDLINSHGKGAGLYARKVGFILGVPVVQTFHGLHYDYRNRLVRFLYISLEKLLAHFTTRFINVSAGQQREGLAMKLFPGSKSRVVVNGIDTAVVERVNLDRAAFRRKLGLGPGDFVATMVARFDRVKGHERLVGMLPNLLKKIPNLKVVFAGDGEQRYGTEKLAKKLGVSSAIRFLGQRSDVFKIFKASDVAILPSYHEGMPLTVLEAMACRLPVVGSDVVGIRDLVKDGENGYLVDFDNVAEVAKALRKLSSSISLRHKMGEQGRRLVEDKFSMEKFVKNTLTVYQESLK